MSTTPKPAGWAPEYAQAFRDEAVARVYHLRPPYPDDLFSTLTELIVDQPRTVLDLGCGPGDLARRLVDGADRVDAVDASLAMIERGRTLERGRQANLRWIHGRAEEVPLDPPYALVTAGDSLHWMDWSVVMPQIRASLTRERILRGRWPDLGDRTTGGK